MPRLTNLRQIFFHRFTDFSRLRANICSALAQRNSVLSYPEQAGSREQVVRTLYQLRYKVIVYLTGTTVGG